MQRDNKSIYYSSTILWSLSVYHYTTTSSLLRVGFNRNIRLKNNAEKRIVSAYLSKSVVINWFFKSMLLQIYVLKLFFTLWMKKITDQYRIWVAGNIGFCVILHKTHFINFIVIRILLNIKIWRGLTHQQQHCTQMLKPLNNTILASLDFMRFYPEIPFHVIFHKV